MGVVVWAGTGKLCAESGPEGEEVIQTGVDGMPGVSTTLPSWIGPIVGGFFRKEMGSRRFSSSSLAPKSPNRTDFRFGLDVGEPLGVVADVDAVLSDDPDDLDKHDVSEVSEEDAEEGGAERDGVEDIGAAEVPVDLGSKIRHFRRPKMVFCCKHTFGDLLLVVVGEAADMFGEDPPEDASDGEREIAMASKQPNSSSAIWARVRVGAIRLALYCLRGPVLSQ